MPRCRLDVFQIWKQAEFARVWWEDGNAEFTDGFAADLPGLEVLADTSYIESYECGRGEVGAKDEEVWDLGGPEGFDVCGDEG
jgi:hypothetical protein